MARIEGVKADQAGPMVKLVYRFMRRGMTKLTGGEPARGSGIEPVELWAHRPKMMSGMGKFQGAVRKGDSVEERIRLLVELAALLTVVNLNRFNAAFGVGSAGFSDGMVCVLPDRPAVAA